MESVTGRRSNLGNGANNRVQNSENRVKRGVSRAFALFLCFQIWDICAQTPQITMGWPGSLKDRMRVDSIAIDPRDADVVYASIITWGYQRSRMGLFRSVNGGKDWAAVAPTSETSFNPLRI